MSHIIHDRIARGEALRVDHPAGARARHQVEVDRNFGLPSALYAATIACYLGFVVIASRAFGNPALVIPLGIIVLLIAAAFAVPAIWTRLKGNTSEPETLGEFESRGIITHTGRLAAQDAATQMLILPVLLVCWGLAVAVIAALVT
jgi:hypothetical protein